MSDDDEVSDLETLASGSQEPNSRPPIVRRANFEGMPPPVYKPENKDDDTQSIYESVNSKLSDTSNRSFSDFVGSHSRQLPVDILEDDIAAVDAAVDAADYKWSKDELTAANALLELYESPVRSEQEPPKKRVTIGSGIAEMDNDVSNLLNQLSGIATSAASDAASAARTVMPFIGRAAITTGTIICKVIKFAVSGKIQFLLVLGLCGAAYKQSVYAQIVFDYILSIAGRLFGFISDITGLTDFVIWLGQITGITTLLTLIPRLISLLEQIPEMIKVVSTELAQGAAASVARDQIVNGVITKLQGQIGDIDAIIQALPTQPQPPQSLITALTQGMAQGFGNMGASAGVRSITELLVRHATSNQLALQNGGARKWKRSKSVKRQIKITRQYRKHRNVISRGTKRTHRRTQRKNQRTTRKSLV